MNNFFEQWRTILDDMKTQGKMDAGQAFEKQKEQLRNMIAQAKEQLDKTTDMAEDQVKNMREKLEELNLQLHLGKAETAEAFEAQRKKIEPALHEVYEAGKKAYHTGYNQAMGMFDAQADWFKTHLEMMQLQFSLAKMDARDEAEEVKKKIAEKMEELNRQSSVWTEKARENVDEWTNMAKENMEKFRNWMKDVVKN